MIWKSRRVSAGGRPARSGLFVERLEDRRLMDAGGLPSLYAGPSEGDGRVLVAYQNAERAVVRQVSRGASLEQTVTDYAADTSVRFAEPDFRVRTAALPNDPYGSYTWGLHNTGQNGGTPDADIDAPEAWDTIKGSLSSVVAIIDSGIDYLHPDLYQNIWLNQGEIPDTIKPLLVDLDGDSLITFRDLNDPLNQGSGKITDLNGNGYIDGRDLLYSTTVGGWADGTSNDGDAYVDDLVGWNFVTDTNDPFDDNGHGTHVAGTIGANGNNGRGVAGILWDVQLVGLKFLDATGGGYVSSAIAALDYAVSKSIMLSNNSWGGGGYSQALYDAINAARSQGHVFVAAAGNGGADGVGDNNDATPHYPSGYNLDNIVTVAATDNQDRLAGFSNFGATSVDVAAPGVEILSALPGGYGYASGTSMAAPHVTGVVAMVRAKNPAWSYSQAIAHVLNHGDKLTVLDGKLLTEARLNAHRAVSATVADTTGPRVVSAVANASGTSPVSRVRVTFSESLDPASFTVADITSFSGPNGAIAPSGVIAVAGTDGKVFDVTFSKQATPGTYRFNIGPNVRDASGNAMDQDQDGVIGESTEDRYSVGFVIEGSYTYVSSPGAAIRDGYATVVSIHVDRDIKITDLNVKLDISHTYDGDLRMYLTAPDGSWISLVRHRGGSGDNFKSTVLDDEASGSIAYGKSPFSGSYRPESSLSAFDGKNARGTWRLQVEDWYRGGTGRINSWALTFEGAVAAAATRSLSGPAAGRSLPAADESLRLGTAHLSETARRQELKSLTVSVGGRDSAEVQRELGQRGRQRGGAALATRAREAVGRVAEQARAGELQDQLSQWRTAVDDLLSQDDLMTQLETLLTSRRRR